MNNNGAHLRRPGPRFETLVDLLEWRAEHDSDRLACRFLRDGEEAIETISYRELAQRAKKIAAVLQSEVKPGDRALLVYPPGLELIAAFAGCVYAGVIFILVEPPRPARLERFTSKIVEIAKDAEPSVILIGSDIRKRIEADLTQATGIKRWIATDEIPEDGGEYCWQGPALNADDLAFLQYTSGSTTAPRGVMVSHGNLMHNLKMIAETYTDRVGNVCVFWLPPYHDMGLIGGILSPVYIASPVTLMAPEVFAQRPIRWLKAISRYKGTISSGPNFAYDLCVRKVTGDQRLDLDLSTWAAALNGAEPVNPRTIEEFTRHFEPCGFHPDAFKPSYGLAESTVMVSGTSTREGPHIRGFKKDDLEQGRVVPCALSDPGAKALVSCGRPVAEVIIIDPGTDEPCPPDVVGEIWTSGPSVAAGYWNRPDETERVFGARVNGVEGKPFLRTGDLGFLLNGELFITGRLKDLIIIDGTNHYPPDIEQSVGACDDAFDSHDCAAFAVVVDGREMLVVVAGVNPRTNADPQSLHRAVHRVVKEKHDIRVHDVVVVRMGRVPKTSSGKIMRSACRKSYLEKNLDVWRVP